MEAVGCILFAIFAGVALALCGAERPRRRIGQCPPGCPRCRPHFSPPTQEG